MKKTVIALIIAVAVTLCSGCDIVSDILSFADAPEKAKALCNSVYDAFLDRDAEKLEALFSEKTAETHDLSSEIDAAFALIDGNIKSYKEIDADVPDGNFHFVSDTYNQLVCRNTVWGVKTDTGAVYSIRFIHCLNFADHDESYNGIYLIKIISGSDYDGKELCSIGGMTEIYEPQKVSAGYTQVTDTTSRVSIEEEYGESAALNVINALNDGNTDALYSYFKAEMQTQELKDRLAEAVSLIDGKLVSYSRIESDYDEEGVNYGEMTYFSGSAEVWDLMSDGGKMYEISIHAVFIDKKQPDEVGFFCLKLKEVEPQSDGFEHKIIAEITVKE